MIHSPPPPANRPPAPTSLPPPVSPQSPVSPASESAPSRTRHRHALNDGNNNQQNGNDENNNNNARRTATTQRSSTAATTTTANFAQHPVNLPPMTIMKAPTLLAATLLHEPWTYELFAHQHQNSCQLSYLCCPLLHFSRQLHTIDPHTYTGCLYNSVVCLACVADVLTLRSPLACYPGLGTALFGWYTRLHLRLKYRIAGLGVKDLLYTSCCANYVAQQQIQELEKEGVGYPVPGGSWFCCLHHTTPAHESYTYSPSFVATQESASLVNHRPH